MDCLVILLLLAVAMTMVTLPSEGTIGLVEPQLLTCFFYHRNSMKFGGTYALLKK